MKTYIINLERSKARREHIIGEAERCGLDYELVNAVDGSQLTDEELHRLCDEEQVRKHSDWLTPGMIGCALSHYNVYTKIVENDVDVALVLEDDACLPNNLPELLREISEEVQPNEVISLFYMSFDPCQLSKKGKVGLSNNYGLYYPVDVNQVISTAGYVITKQAAKTMENIVLPVRVSPDSWGHFYEHKGFDSFRCVYPVPLKLTAVQSDIHSQSWRGVITHFIERNKIPMLHKAVRSIRISNIESMTKIKLVNTVSPIEKTN